MEGFWKAAAAVLISVILALSVGRQEISILLTIAATCMVTAIAIQYMEPVMDLIRELGSFGQVSGSVLEILLKAVGVAMVSELVGKLCADGGSTSLGKTIQLLGSTVILYLSIPLIQSFFTLIQDILGEL